MPRTTRPQARRRSLSTRRAQQATYTGATTADYHDPATVSATLTDPDSGTPIVGTTLTFQLGSSSIDTCSAVTDDLGGASCSITPTQPAGNYPITAAFAGDTYYLPQQRLTHVRGHP